MSTKKTEGENKKKGGFFGLFSKPKDDVPYDAYEEIFMNRVSADSLQEEQAEESVPDENTDEGTVQEEEGFYQYELEEQPEAVQSEEQPVLIAEKEEIPVSAELDTEKSEAGIDNTVTAPDANNATAVFSFENELPEGSETELEEVNPEGLQNSAKTYFDENHASTLDDKVDELCKLAENGFEDSQEHTDLGLEIEPEEPEAEPDKKSKKKKKNIKNSVVSNEDMDILIKISGGKGAVDKNYAPILDSDEPDVEYTDRAQEKSIVSGLRKKTAYSILNIIASLAAFIACLYFETAVGTNKWHPAFFEAGRYGLVYAMSMLQIMFVSVIFNLDGVIRGFKGMSKNKARPESAAVVSVIICTIHVIASATFASHSAQMVTYCSVGCFALLILAINSFIKNYTALASFCIAASKSPKYTTEELDATSHEAAAFSKYLEEDTTIFTVEKAGFISGFFRKLYACPESSKKSFSVYMTAIIAGIICGAASGLITFDAYTAITTGCVVALAALPANLIIATALPFFTACIKSLRTKTAFIGEAACDAYTNAGILSFDDSEVFPPRGVKVSSIRTYGDTRIDKVIIYMARIFNKLDGPLSYIFDRSVQDGDETVGEAQILHSTPDGIKVEIDGREIILGTSNYLKLYDIHTPSDNIDESFLQSLGSIIYMADGKYLAAKFYIKYAMNQSFEGILRSLYDAGICAGVKTIDPCVNNQLIAGNLRGSGYPVSVIKKESLGTEQQKVKEQLSGSIISLTGTHNFLKAFIRLDTLRNTYRSNMSISRISAIIGMLAAAALTLSGTVSFLSPAFLIVLAFLWCIPTIFISLLTK